MISLRTSLVLLVSALFASAVVASVPDPHRSVERISCYQAFQQCEFEFEYTSGIPTFRIGGPENEAFTPRVVSRNDNEILGVLNSNGITPEFIIHRQAFPITLFGSQKFTPTAFKPFSIPYTSGSGVGRETFHGDQLSVARGQCVRLFFTSYQTLKPNGDVKDNVNNVPRRANKCVVFRTRH